MRFDVPTLYYLLVGALLLVSSMTLWESRFAGRRGPVLRLCSGGLVLFAAGIAVLPAIADTPPLVGRGLSHVLIVCGYGALVAAAASLTGRRGWRLPLLAFCGIYAAAWLPLAPAMPLAGWHALAALTITVLNLVAAALVVGGPQRARLRARPILACAFLVHAGLYAARVWLLSGPPMSVAARHDLAAATMFEGVLYAVAVPALFLAAIREERERQLVAVSRTDFLTGLDNRRALTEAARRLAPGTAHTLLLADLDHFKRVNDTHGHETGDAVLKLFARIAAAELPAGAVLARLGGEEFAALLPGSPETQRETAERLAARFREATGRVSSLAAPVTVSLGLAPLPAGPGGLTTALGGADRALYRAKAGGRDRVELAQEGQVLPLPIPPRGVSRGSARRARRPWSTRAAG